MRQYPSPDAATCRPTRADAKVSSLDKTRDPPSTSTAPARLHRESTALATTPARLRLVAHRPPGCGNRNCRTRLAGRSSNRRRLRSAGNVLSASPRVRSSTAHAVPPWKHYSHGPERNKVICTRSCDVHRLGAGALPGLSAGAHRPASHCAATMLMPLLRETRTGTLCRDGHSRDSEARARSFGVAFRLDDRGDLRRRRSQRPPPA